MNILVLILSFLSTLPTDFATARVASQREMDVTDISLNFESDPSKPENVKTLKEILAMEPHNSEWYLATLVQKLNLPKNSELAKALTTNGEIEAKRPGCPSCRMLVLAMARYGKGNISETALKWTENSLSGEDPKMHHPKGLTKEQRQMQFVNELSQAGIVGSYRNGLANMLTFIDFNKYPKNELNRAFTTWQYGIEGERGVIYNDLLRKIYQNAKEDKAISEDEIGAVEFQQTSSSVLQNWSCPSSTPAWLVEPTPDTNEKAKVCLAALTVPSEISKCELSLHEKQDYLKQALKNEDESGIKNWATLMELAETDRKIRVAKGDKTAYTLPKLIEDSNSRLDSFSKAHADELIKAKKKYNAFMSRPRAADEFARHVLKNVAPLCLKNATKDEKEKSELLKKKYESSRLFPDLYTYFTSLPESCVGRAMAKGPNQQVDYQIQYLMKTTRDTFKSICSHAELDKDQQKEYAKMSGSFWDRFKPKQSSSGEE